MEKLETLKNVVDNAIIGSMCVVGKVETKKETNSFGRIWTTSLLCSSDGHYVVCTVQKEKVGKNYDEIIKNLKIGKEVYLKGSMSKRNIFYVTFASQNVFRMELNHFEETNEIKVFKYIYDGDEKSAIDLIKKCGDNFNVNYECCGRILIFSAISKKMGDLCENIIKHPKFNCSVEDGFGETLLESLLYLLGIATAENDTSFLERMIRALLNNSSKQDLNAVDLNNDTAINISCEYPNLLWVTEDLANREYVNPNIIDDFGLTALTNAIRNDNIDAIKLLSKRKDLIVRDKDIELATKHGINLSEYGL